MNAGKKSVSQGPGDGRHYGETTESGRISKGREDGVSIPKRRNDLHEARKSWAGVWGNGSQQDGNQAQRARN